MTLRWIVPCLIFLMLALGGAWSFRDEEGRAGDLVMVNELASDQTAAGSGPKSGPASDARGFYGEGAVQEIPVKPISTIGAGEAALLAEEIELRALATGLNLSLTEKEWARLAGVVLDTQAVRHAYEAEIAVASVSEAGLSRLEIPVYVEAGAVLRLEFYGGLSKQMGQAAALEVVAKLSSRLEARFAGFGAAVQTLDFSNESSRDGEAGSVTRTIVFRGEDCGRDAARTRRETIFPTMEDPDGLQWGPLLARIGVVQESGKKAGG